LHARAGGSTAPSPLERALGSGSSHWVLHPGRRAARPEPGDLSVRATCRSLAGGMVALRIQAQALAHLRTVGGGPFCYAPLGTSHPPRGTPPCRHSGVREGKPLRAAVAHLGPR